MKTTVENKSNATLRTGLGRSRWPAVLFCLTVLGAMAVQGQTIIQEFYLPMPEGQIYTVFNKHIPYGTNVNMESVFSIVVTTPGTEITYDQWEGGYEADINSPTDGNTEIWGDNNDINGICPGFISDPDGLPAGTVITLTNSIPAPDPRNPVDVYYDGGDRVGATKAVTITRICYEADLRKTSQSVVVEVLSTLDHGLEYIAPVGTDDPASYNYMFYNADMMVMADQSNTTVTVDIDGSGPVAPFTTNVNRGAEGAFLVEGISKGATVSADKPLQVHMITGRFTGDYETRSFVLRPSGIWSSEYIIPVGTMNTDYPGLVFLFNPNVSPLTVTYTHQTGSGSVVIPGNNGVATYELPQNSGTLLESSDGSSFFALCAMNTDLTGTDGALFDWGFAPIPRDGLTPEVICGWGPGAITNGVSGATGAENGSPVWVTAPSNTTLYVDFLGDSQGPLMDAEGDRYDTNFVVSALESIAIYDPSRPDQTGMRVYTLDGTRIAGAWGADASVAEPGPPYLDMGYALVPFPVVSITKVSVLLPQPLDTEPFGLLNVGDTLEYTIQVRNQGALPLGNLAVFDTLPIQLDYVENSTTFDGAPVPDDTDPFLQTAFPLDTDFFYPPGGITITNLLQDGLAEFVYRVRVVSPGDIQNIGSAEGGPSVIEATNTVVAVSTVSIGDAVVVEGDSGTTNLVFLVTLSDLRTDGDTTVDFFTLNGTNNPALAGSDYVATSGTLTLPAGETNGIIMVPVNGDTDVELDETLFVMLTNAIFQTTDPDAAVVVVGDGQGVGTIINDDSELFWDVGWNYNPRADSWYGTLSLSNHNLSAESLTTNVWYEVLSNEYHRLRFPTGPDPVGGPVDDPDDGPDDGPGWYYLDVSSQFIAAMPGVGDGDLLLNPGESVDVITNIVTITEGITNSIISDIELWGRGAVIPGSNFFDRVKADWVPFEPPVPAPDQDGDGVSNADEEIAGTDSADSSSVFTINVRPESGGNLLFWEGRADRVYTVLSTPSLSAPFSVLVSNIAGVEPVTAYLDTNVTSSGQTFYRGEVRLK